MEELNLDSDYLSAIGDWQVQDTVIREVLSQPENMDRLQNAAVTPTTVTSIRIKESTPQFFWSWTRTVSFLPSRSSPPAATTSTFIYKYREGDVIGKDGRVARQIKKQIAQTIVYMDKFVTGFSLDGWDDVGKYIVIPPALPRILPV